MKIVYLLILIKFVFCIKHDEIKLFQDYFLYKNAKYVCYFSCNNRFGNLQTVRALTMIGARTCVVQIDEAEDFAMEKVLRQWRVSVGVILEGSCNKTASVLDKASEAKLIDATHFWLVTAPETNNSSLFIEEYFQDLNLSVDADMVVATKHESGYTLTDVFNFGKLQGNALEMDYLGSWRPQDGLDISSKGYKYHRRWDFHNLTLRAISVILDRPGVFKPELLSDLGYAPGVSAMTKITSQLLNLLKEQHNFRFNYTIVDRWIGSPERNSTLAVTNSLFWGQQDVSCTCARIFPRWLAWVDVCLPPTTSLQTKFYYLMLERGVGEYENRFLTPLSAGAWAGAAAAAAACAGALTAAARVEARPHPALYGLFSVSAALFQQDFEDGVPHTKISSQGRRMALAVMGGTSMLLYNYYTSSVVSWLLAGAAPAVRSLERLLAARLELVFEDVGYTRGWLENPGFYYFSGYVNPIEDQLREVKVTKAKRTVDPLQPLTVGVQLMKTGLYAYHTEPYSASHQMSRSLSERELCSLGSLPVMLPAPVYVMLQKRSPYKEFFSWSMMRLLERGHSSAARRRFAGGMPACGGRAPRALALGQAAPAFLLLLALTVLALGMLAAERACYRVHGRGRQAGKNKA